jgi:RND family efflux transporter MFP subunit
MSTRRFFGHLLIAGLLVGPGPDALAGAPTAGPLACLILPDKLADLGSPVIGVLASVEVERGDMVKKGQILARLGADVERANTSVARSRADAQADLRAAESAREFAAIQLRRMEDLVAQNFMSPAAADKAKADFDQAREHVEQVREQLRTSGQELSLYQAQLAQRAVRSPFDGVVVERYLNPGERVEDKPMLKIAAIDPLRVELVAPVALFGSLRVGQSASVRPDLPGTGARDARIVQIDKVLDPASNTFRLRLALPNPNGTLPAGLRCQADFGIAAGPQGAGSAPTGKSGPAALGDAAAANAVGVLRGAQRLADRR